MSCAVGTYGASMKHALSLRGRSGSAPPNSEAPLLSAPMWLRSRRANSRVAAVGLGVAIPLALRLDAAARQWRDNKRFGGPPMEDAFTPIGRVIDAMVLVGLGGVLVVPGALLLLLS